MTAKVQSERRSSIPGKELHRLTNDAALGLFTTILGQADQQRSDLLWYRFGSDFQADWRAEVGHWLHTAQRLGFAEALRDRVVRRLQGGEFEATGDEPDPNDGRHRMLHADLAPARVVHCLDGMGWTFDAWEPARAPEDPSQHLDVDVSMVAPDGTRVDVQVKAPDQPGYVVNHRRVDGENDEYIVRGVEKAAPQLPRSGAQAKMIAVCAQRTWPLTGDPSPVVEYVLGGSVQYEDDSFWLPRSDLGVFSTAAWQHVSAVMLLDMNRGIDVLSYGLVVVLNPWADVQASPEWFPWGRVCFVDEDRIVRWIGGAPGRCTLREGTRLVDELP